jgi:hypothetical protein
MAKDEKPKKKESTSQAVDKPKAEDFLQVFKRGVQFTEELLAENERLRYRVVRLEEENRSLAQQTMVSQAYEDLLDQMKTLEEERSSLLERFKSVEEETQDFKSRYREIEDENNRLANLYIASYQLNSTLDLKEVVRISFEIIINLVGSMDFALYIADGSKMVPVCAEGRPLASLSLITMGKGSAGRAAQDRVLYVSGDDLTKASVDEPKVCVPLIVGDIMLGMFVVFSFLVQKTCITELDRELFKLLGGHAAMAIFAARLNMVADSKIVHDASSYLRLLNS